MPIERASGGASLIDVLDRVLDKGIVIDAWVRVSVVGIDLITVEARVVVASIETYLKYSEAVALVGVSARAEMPVSPLPVDGGRRRTRGERPEGGEAVAFVPSTVRANTPTSANALAR